jgi:tetratricopeptide (TPR) repeat protein
VVSVFSLSLVAVVASAEPDVVKRAQTHFRAGKTLYDLGQYPDAIREFAAGYALVPKPEFLLNLGQAYRRAHDLPQAREMFLRYLEKAPPNAPERGQVRDTLRELDAELEKAPPAPPPAAPPATDRPVEAVAAEPRLTPGAAPEPVVPEVVESPSPTRHLVWAVPLAVAVAVGIGVGVWAATRSPPDACAGATGLGCFDLRHP